jgi:Na+-transporting NADH:ubiquinone oxidoreductase subunit NqrC
VKKSDSYTILFSIALCSLAAFILTFTSRQLAGRIEANAMYNRVSAIVTALGLADGAKEREKIIRIYQAEVATVTKGEMQVFEGRRNGELVGYGMEVIGQGKYGPIKGVLSVDRSGRNLLGLVIYEQTETPGLGGRIGSEEWLSQFKGLPMITDGTPGIRISNVEKGPNVVDGITGASLTTYQVAKMLNRAIAGFLSGGRQLVELNLEIDAITGATPGYPRNVKLPPNLREEVRRPEFMVPPDVVNIGLNQPVTSSMEFEPIIGELSQITDGVKSSGEFDFVEMDFGPQWVQIDLGEPKEIFCVVLWHYYRNPIVYKDVIVQIADDEKFTTNVQTLFNNDFENNTGLGAGTDTTYRASWWGEIVDARTPEGDGTHARHVRIYTDGGYGNEPTRWIEIAVFGK